jgi:hypothetical protein
VQAKTSVALNTPPKKVITRNFFAYFRATEMDSNTSGFEDMPHEESFPDKTGRLPPIMLTSQTNLIQLQRQPKGMVKDTFEFCSMRNRTRAIIKTMDDFSAVKSYLE